MEVRPVDFALARSAPLHQDEQTNPIDTQISMNTRSGHRPFRPAWSAACLCGSGKRFRDCCHGRLPGTAIGEAWHADAERQRWGATILSMRADVTQYTIWHIDHTAPFKGRSAPTFRGKSLLKIDVEGHEREVLRGRQNTTIV